MEIGVFTLICALIALLGFLKIKKKIFKIILMIIVVFNMVLSCFVFWYIYTSDYKLREVDVRENSGYVLYLLEVGDPDFPFGSTHAKLTLKLNGEKVVSYQFDIKNDGKHLSNMMWEVDWQEKYVVVIINGEEQMDEQINIYYDGNVTTKELETKKGEN